MTNIPTYIPDIDSPLTKRGPAVILGSPKFYSDRLGCPKVTEIMAHLSNSANHHIADSLRRLDLYLHNFPDYRRKFFDEISPNNLSGLLQRPMIDMSFIDVLRELQILPLPAVLAFSQGQRNGLKENLEALLSGI